MAPGTRTAPPSTALGATRARRWCACRPGSAQPTALVLAAQAGHRALFVVTDAASGHWSVSSPLTLGSGSSVRASAVQSGGALSVVTGSKRDPSVSQINTDGTWTTLPPPPAGTLALAWVLPTAVPFGGPDPRCLYGRRHRAARVCAYSRRHQVGRRADIAGAAGLRLVVLRHRPDPARHGVGPHTTGTRYRDLVRVTDGDIR